MQKAKAKTKEKGSRQRQRQTQRGPGKGICGDQKYLTTKVFGDQSVLRPKYLEGISHVPSGGDAMIKENLSVESVFEEKDFLNTIRDTIQSTAKKSGYVDIEQNTIPYMILYIPIENIFQMLLNSEVPSTKQPFIEYAASQKVMLAGPATLLMQLEIIKPVSYTHLTLPTNREV